MRNLDDSCAQRKVLLQRLRGEIDARMYLDIAKLTSNEGDTSKSKRKDHKTIEIDHFHQIFSF